tara:strand:- start:492 stop:668 length:177 start_codon:yes stop_codon:yes gene_type:complete
VKIKIEIELDTSDPDDMDRLDELTAGALRSEFRQAAREIAEELQGSTVSEDIEEDNDE